MAAMITAIQLTPIGIVSLQTLTVRLVDQPQQMPNRKNIKKKLAKRSPVLGEFISRL